MSIAKLEQKFEDAKGTVSLSQVVWRTVSSKVLKYGKNAEGEQKASQALE